MTHVPETCDKCGIRWTEIRNPGCWIIPKQEGVPEELVLCPKCGDDFRNNFKVAI